MYSFYTNKLSVLLAEINLAYLKLLYHVLINVSTLYNINLKTDLAVHLVQSLFHPLVKVLL